MIVENWFPTSVWYDDISIDFDSCIQKCFDLQKSDSGVQLSNVGGWQSKPFYMNASFDAFEFLELYVSMDEKKNELCNLISNGRNEKIKLIQTNSWININQPGNRNALHFHPLSTFSSVLYLQCDDNSGDLQLFRGDMMEHYPVDTNYSFFHNKVEYAPKKGRIMFFPSWIAHSVTENKSNRPRISIATNYVMEINK